MLIQELQDVQQISNCDPGLSPLRCSPTCSFRVERQEIRSAEISRCGQMIKSPERSYLEAKGEPWERIVFFCRLGAPHSRRS